MKHLLFSLYVCLVFFNAWGDSSLFRKDAVISCEVMKEIALKYGGVPDCISEFVHSYKNNKYYMFVTPTDQEIVTYTYYARESRNNAFYSQMDLIHHILESTREKNANIAVPLLKSILKSNQDYIWQSTTIEKGGFRASFCSQSLAQVVRKKLTRTPNKSLPQKLESHWLEVVDMKLRMAVNDWQLYSFGNTVPFTMKVLNIKRNVMPVIFVKMLDKESISYAIIVQSMIPHFFLLSDIYSSTGYTSSYLKLLDVLDSVLPISDDDMKLRCLSLITQLVDESQKTRSE